MSLIFRNLGQFPEETAHVLQNLVSANGLIMLCCSRMSLEHTTENSSSQGFLVGAFHQVVFAQNNKKRRACLSSV